MKDQRGIYYHPFPDNKKIRMYVKKEENDIWFRLWNQDDGALWMEHGWIPYGAVKKASAVYDKKNFDPDKAYDADIAETLLRDESPDP